MARPSKQDIARKNLKDLINKFGGVYKVEEESKVSKTTIYNFIHSIEINGKKKTLSLDTVRKLRIWAAKKRITLHPGDLNPDMADVEFI